MKVTMVPSFGVTTSTLTRRISTASHSISPSASTECLLALHHRSWCITACNKCCSNLPCFPPKNLNSSGDPLLELLSSWGLGLNAHLFSRNLLLATACRIASAASWHKRNGTNGIVIAECRNQQHLDQSWCQAGDNWDVKAVCLTVHSPHAWSQQRRLPVEERSCHGRLS